MQRDTPVFRTLLTARQRNGLDEVPCRLVLELLCASAAAHAALQRELEALGLTELKFTTLVVLFVLDPSPATPAELAAQIGVTRSTITDVLDHLEARGFVLRQRDTQDRRVIYLHLTDTGRATADAVLLRYLQTAGRIGQGVPPAEQEALLASLVRLHDGSAGLSVESVAPISP